MRVKNEVSYETKSLDSTFGYCYLWHAATIGFELDSQVLPAAAVCPRSLACTLACPHIDWATSRDASMYWTPIATSYLANLSLAQRPKKIEVHIHLKCQLGTWQFWNLKWNFPKGSKRKIRDQQHICRNPVGGKNLRVWGQSKSLLGHQLNKHDIWPL